MAEEILDVVNEQDEVIGQALRSEIHAKGLLHREIGVYFITPSGEIIFQIRGDLAETNKGKLSPTVGGHVEMGDMYEETAIKEIQEETGVQVSVEQLHLLEKLLSDKRHADMNIHNRNLRRIYGYVYHGNIEDLKVEEGKGAGFVAYSLKSLFNPTEEMKNRLLSYADPDRHDLYRKLQDILKDGSK